MSISLGANGNSFNYPETNDTSWGDNATNWASAVSAALTSIGLGSSLNAKAVIAINSTTKGFLPPVMTTGQRDAISSPPEGLIVYNSTTDTLDAYDGSAWQQLAKLSGATFTGPILLPDGSIGAPSLSFSGDTNTGIIRSAADQLDIVTGGESRFRLESTGQIKAVYESQVGTDYNTTLHNGYFCRAWVNFNGTGTIAIRASGNVSSLTDHGTGDYSTNFTTSLPDVNYSPVYMSSGESSLGNTSITTLSTGSFRMRSSDSGGIDADKATISIGIFR
jgi:hypothetical protein